MTHSRAWAHYDINVAVKGKHVARVTWKPSPQPHSMATHPRAHCLRSNILDMHEDQLWHTCIMLTEVESVFRSMKSELGARPNHHHKESRAEGHLFVSVLAYQIAHAIRLRLRPHGIRWSWERIREELNTYRRATRVRTLEDGRTQYSRMCDQASFGCKTIYEALERPLPPLPIKISTV